DAGHERHDEIRQPVLLAGREDRHDVRMVELRDRAGLAMEAFAQPVAGEGLRREHLDGHGPPEGLLQRLEDDAHAAAGDLAAKAEVAETAVADAEERIERLRRNEQVLRLRSLHEGDGGEELADLLGEVGMARDVRLDRRRLAAPESRRTSRAIP